MFDELTEMSIKQRRDLMPFHPLTAKFDFPFIRLGRGWMWRGLFQRTHFSPDQSLFAIFQTLYSHTGTEML